MAKLESTFKNMVVALFLVTLIAAGALGFVYELTKGPIEIAKIEAKNRAIRNVLPEYDEVIDEFKLPTTPGNDSLEFYPAYKAGNLVGVAIKSYTKNGFSGYISIMVGIDINGNFSGYEVLEHKETPGLGTKMDVWFNNPEKPTQLVLGKNPETTNLTVSKDGGEIDAITASTITSRAFLEALTMAYEAFKENNIEPTKTVNTVSNKEEV